MSPEYHKKDARVQSYKFIQNKLSEHDVSVTIKQISDKLTSLRTYYGAEKRKVESSKRSGAGRKDLQFSKWRFFEHLHFLADSFPPRKTESNLNIGALDNEEDLDNSHAPSSQRSAKRNFQKQDPVNEVVPIMKQALAKMDTPPPDQRNCY